MTAPTPAEWISAADAAAERAFDRWLQVSVCTTADAIGWAMQDAARRAVLAVAPLIAESIAAGFDALADAAKTADREHRDVDVVLAHQSAARFVRDHAKDRPGVPAAAIPAPTGTPADHPHADPSDGRTECRRCGKYVFLIIHSCKGIPVTAAARARAADRPATSPTGDTTR